MPLPLQDKYEIQELMHRYAYAIDVDCTEQEWFDLFTADAILESPHSGYNAGIEGLRNFRQMFVPRRGKTQIRHVITNFLIDGDGDAARLKAYFLEYKTELIPQPPQTSPRTEFFFGGSYDITLVRQAGKWRMKHRVVSIDDRPGPPRTA